MTLPVSMSRSSSQPSPLSHQTRAVSTYPHTSCYCCAPAQYPERQRYYSELPGAVIKKELQSQDQLARTQYQGHQPLQSGRSDWTTTATPPTVQQPMGLLTRVSDHRRLQLQLQAADAAAVTSAQGSHKEEYSSTNSPFLIAQGPSAHETSSVAGVAQQPDLSLNLFRLKKRAKLLTPEGARGNNILQYQKEVHYAQPRHLSKQQYRLSSPSSQFHASIPQYFDYPDSAMSLTYETAQQFMSEANYPRMHDPQEQEDLQHEHPRYPSPPLPSGEMNSYNHQSLDAAQEDPMENLPQLRSSSQDAPSPGRSKPIPKPAREIIKNELGRYICSWAGCTEEVRDFGRKCEWSKHMDKHDRPYKCRADGCEKLPGFTYSGGLLRHEREVHGKHGGPRKQLNCPHSTCKRHTGKGFSRQENLNEHLRRVHTSDGTVLDGGETEEDGEDTKVGQKRKRGTGQAPSDNDIRAELKRLRTENEELRRRSEAHTAQTAEMMAQIRQLQSAVTIQHPRMPNAPMM